MPTASRVAPRRSPRQARSAETLERILEAAARVFSHHGYAAGTTNRIAADASMSIGSLYQYFPNKDAILLALARRHMHETTARLRQSFVTHHGDITTLIAVVVDTMVDAHAADAELHEVLFEQAPRPDELTAELEQLEEELVVAVAALLRGAAMEHPPHGSTSARSVSETTPQTDSPVRDRFDDVARVTVATVESLVHRMVATSHQRMTVPRFRDELVTMVTGYVTSALATPHSDD